MSNIFDKTKGEEDTNWVLRENIVSISPIQLLAHTIFILDTMQSSAYVPLCVHGNLSNLGSLAILG